MDGCLSLYSYIKPQLSGKAGCFHHGCLSLYSYIKPQLSGIGSAKTRSCLSLYSYIKPQRNQATVLIHISCLSLYSYIKPQPGLSLLHNPSVVYLSIPTSNHNRHVPSENLATVVYLSIPTSNHNQNFTQSNGGLLFISLFLHQTTTRSDFLSAEVRCLSLYSYIKPQPLMMSLKLISVVYLSIPTSNHNRDYAEEQFAKLFISLFLHQTTT